MIFLSTKSVHAVQAALQQEVRQKEQLDHDLVCKNSFKVLSNGKCQYYHIVSCLKTAKAPLEVQHNQRHSQLVLGYSSNFCAYIVSK